MMLSRGRFLKCHRAKPDVGCQGGHDTGLGGLHMIMKRERPQMKKKGSPKNLIAVISAIACGVSAPACTDKQLALIEHLADKAIPGAAEPQQTGPAMVATPTPTSTISPQAPANVALYSLTVEVPVARGGTGYKVIVTSADPTVSYSEQAEVVNGKASLHAPAEKLVAIAATAPDPKIYIQGTTVIMASNPTFVRLDTWGIE